MLKQTARASLRVCHIVCDPAIIKLQGSYRAWKERNQCGNLAAVVADDFSMSIAAQQRHGLHHFPELQGCLELVRLIVQYAV
jgi:hypothetical protein